MCSKTEHHTSLTKFFNSHPLYASLAESALTHEDKLGRKAGQEKISGKNGPLVVTSHTSILGTNQAAEIEIQPVKVSFIPKVNIRYFATMVMSTVKTP